MRRFRRRPTPASPRSMKCWCAKRRKSWRSENLPVLLRGQIALQRFQGRARQLHAPLGRRMFDRELRAASGEERTPRGRVETKLNVLNGRDALAVAVASLEARAHIVAVKAQPERLVQPHQPLQHLNDARLLG